MSKFDIAGILVEIVSDNAYLNKQFEAFSSGKELEPDLKVEFRVCDKISKPDGNVIIEQIFTWVSNPSMPDHILAYLMSDVSDEILYMLNISKDWSYASIDFLRGGPSPEHNFTGFLGETLFRNCVLRHDGIVIHSSAIQWQGRGIIFSAPSETGKSTQANLWKTHMGAEILNDDRPAIRVINNRPYVFGTPWSGSARTFSNNSAPVSAVVILEQAVRNSISLLTKQEAISRLLPRCFLPYHDSKLMDSAICNVEKIISNIPVYLLQCKPDREAVELVYRVV